MLKLHEHLATEIAAHGIISYPYEGCGLLLGRVEDGNNIVTDIQVMENVWPVEEEKPTRFRIDEQAWLKAELSAMMNGLDIVGIFHSHPDHPAVASPRDLAWASWGGYSYLITEIRNGEAIVHRSWQLDENRAGFDEEAVEMIK